jgi:hypothetical protein
VAKRKALQPWPDNVWHSNGRVRKSISLQVIRQHLQDAVSDGSIVHWRDFTPSSEPWWWGFDAAWRTEDGHRVKARLLLTADPNFVEKKKLTREDLETRDIDVEMGWTITAQADGPWNSSWPSPLEMLSDRHTYDWVTGRMPLLDYSGFTNKAINAEHLQHALSELVKCPWYITVVTHDTRPLHQAQSCKEGAVSTLVPPSLQGRVLEFRVFGDQDEIVNAEGVLPDSRLRLKVGGALVLPTTPRQDAWSLADYAVRRPSGGDMEQLLKETAETVARYASLQPHFCDRARWGVEDLGESWVLPEIELAPQRVLLEKQAAEERVRELETVLSETRDLLRQERETARLVYAAKEETQQRLRKLTESPLVRGAHEARQQAEEAWQAQEASDALAERQASEISWLRRQLAEFPGRSYDEPVPEAQDGPNNWEELLQFAFDRLPKVRVLDDVIEHLDKLDRHPKTKSWVRRTWTALEVYQAYADVKESQGPEVLPHMQAYLRSELATTIFPESWHAPKEAAQMKRDPKYAAMRTFHVEEHGMVFMGEHVRVGGNRPPAPRMYVFDDTSGRTGLIHVGYIGPHLPNGGAQD